MLAHSTRCETVATSSSPPRIGRLARIPAALIVLALTAQVARADALADLRQTVQEYLQTKQKLKRVPYKERETFIEGELSRALVQIAEIGTDESFQFVVGELNGGGPEVGRAAVGAVLKSDHEKALTVLLSGFSRRPAPVRKEIAERLAEPKAELDLGEVGPLVVAALRTARLADVRAELATVLAKVDSLDGARALVATLRSPGRGEEAHELVRAVRDALRKTKNDAVREYLAGDAFRRASDEQLRVLLFLAGELGLEGARDHVVEHLDSREEETAIASLTALQKLGIGDQLPKLVEAVKQGARRSLSFRIEMLDTLAASGDSRAVEAVVAATKEGDMATRAIAMGSLGRLSKSEVALDALVAGLDDREPDVRNAALRALRHFRMKGMVLPLIDVLEKDPVEKLRIDAVKLLVSATGQNMGLVASDWRKWWSTARDGFTFAKESDKGTSVKAYDLDYFGIEVASKRIAFLVDKSSSMTQMVPVKRRLPGDEGGDEGPRGKTRPLPPSGGEGDDGGSKPTKARKLDVLKVELERVIAKLPAATHINIIPFDANYSPWKKSLHSLGGAGRQQAIQFVRDLVNGRGTNVYDTLEFALQDRRVDTIFLLTDGNPSRGKYTDPPTILRKIDEINRVRGATIHCIAFGEKSDLLEKLAAQNGGTYRFVDSY